MFYMNCFIWTCGVTKVYDKNGELGSTKILHYETLLYSKTFCNFVYMTKHFFYIDRNKFYKNNEAETGKK